MKKTICNESEHTDKESEDQKGDLHKSFQNNVEIAGFSDVTSNLPPQKTDSKKPSKTFIEIYGDNYFGYYSSTRVACRGIVVRDGNILLVHATNGDVWMIPGGGVEEGEEETSCVIRELSEETGYIVESPVFVLEIEEYYENEKFISKYYRCTATRRSEIQLTEHEMKAGLESCWIPINDAIAIFSKHQQYAKEDEMKRGIYQREYLALHRILQGK